MSRMDYFSVLYPAIEALNPNEPWTRAAVYNRARKIVADRVAHSAAQNAQISDELLSLEDAIQRIEEEFLRRDAETEEWQIPPPDLLDLEPRSGWIWKTAAAVSVVGALALGAFALFSWMEEKPKPTRLAEIILSPKRAPQPIETVDLSDSDHRPYTLRRQLVYYRTTYPPGALVISKSQRFLYLIRPNVSALRYSIAIGRTCAEAVGLYQVSEKEEFPGWNDSAPSTEPLSPLLANNANPLGARALYLERDDRRIHGISKVVGPASALACFQLVNEDVIDLFDRVPIGTRVIVAMN